MYAHSPDTGLVNAALGRPVTTSSVWKAGFGGPRAVDGLLPLWSKNSVENCFHSGTEATPRLDIALEKSTKVESVTIVGRNHQTNQGDNLQVFVDGKPCGGANALWHTNGKGGQVYTKVR